MDFTVRFENGFLGARLQMILWLLSSKTGRKGFRMNGLYLYVLCVLVLCWGFSVVLKRMVHFGCSRTSGLRFTQKLLCCELLEF